MRIGVDIDGVVSDSYPAWLQELNRHYGKNITVLEDYEMHLVFDVPWDDMNDFFVENVDRLLSMPRPVPGAKEGIERLRREGHEVIFVTARRPEEEKVTLKWLEKYEIPHETVLFSGFKSKVDLVKQWKLEAFVEDHLANALGISAFGVPVFLLATTYNRGKLPAGVTRCATWAEIVALLRHLACR
ncbi:5' nucleotidase, deoxy (pyrimidine), cytosolic type C protein (NT5C) [Peptococcaceae bacterium CEB3]|nr:5' nucleotidase, deoxy (pyrimidine), cytosolic type C protein (NT5C) [Peptococcaceae bacterium CEB3]